MTKDDYISWRNNPTTREYMEAVVSEMDHTVVDILDHLGDNSLTDKYRQGFLHGLRWLIEWKPVVEETDIEMEDETDESSSSGPQGPY